LICALIPARNEEQYIKQCLSSLSEVYTTKGEKIKVILVDDGSIDKTVEEAKKIAKKSKTLSLSVITISENPCSNRLVCALREGINHVDTPLFLRLDADMAVTKEILILHEIIEKNENIGAIGGKMPTFPVNIVNETMNIIEGKFLRSNGFFRTNLVKEIGYMDIYAEDTLIYIKMREKGFKTVFIDKIIAHHLREHSKDQFMRKWEQKARANIELGFPRWYPFLRVIKNTIQCLLKKNTRAVLLCISTFRPVMRGIKSGRIALDKKFKILKYLESRA